MSVLLPTLIDVDWMNNSVLIFQCGNSSQTIVYSPWLRPPQSTLTLPRYQYINPLVSGLTSLFISKLTRWRLIWCILKSFSINERFLVLNSVFHNDRFSVKEKTFFLMTDCFILSWLTRSTANFLLTASESFIGCFRSVILIIPTHFEIRLHRITSVNIKLCMKTIRQDISLSPC